MNNLSLVFTIILGLVLGTSTYRITQNIQIVDDIDFLKKENHNKAVEVGKYDEFDKIKFRYHEDLARDASDAGLRVPELVTKYGYPIETHQVQTPDGYILTVHRIPHGKNEEPSRKAKKVVFMQHGLLCSSADWVLMGPEKGLAYLLADRGYDVWMGNARGNYYSRYHVQWNPDKDKAQFWNFSWHEIGTIDLPSMIDYVLEQTQAKNLFYVGHSQGTTAFWVMASERPEYNDKIRLMTALAPVAFMEHLPNFFLKLVGQFHQILSWVIDMLGQYEFLPSSKFIQLLSETMCDETSELHGICSNILFLIAGYDEAQLNKTMVPVILSNTPAGSSTKQIIHYGQLLTSKEFQQFDYGSKGNKEIYGPEFENHPPRYDLSKITAPVAMFYGQNDLLAAEKDVIRLHQALPHAIRTYKISYPQFSHLDFLWGNDVVELLYKDVFDLLSRY